MSRQLSFPITHQEDLRSSRRPRQYGNYCRSMKKRIGPIPRPFLSPSRRFSFFFNIYIYKGIYQIIWIDCDSEKSRLY